MDGDMCGICGICDFDGQPLDRGLLGRMTNILLHRGPDDEGYFFDRSVGFGFRRLSIIDLAGGKQPMSNEDGSIWLVFNGEIYNYRELRRLLQDRGHVFRTDSDTETIVHGYEEWGDEVVHRLNGMFSFAVWDGPRRKLFLARDRIGIKPLYYAASGNGVVFSSEIKSLLLFPGVDASLNHRAIFDYFSCLYIPGPRTIYNGVRELEPGMTLAATPGGVAVRSYWRPEVSAGPERDLGDWCEELRHCLEIAVKRQMVADVPLGVWLSGGIDSSAITAAMVRTGTGKIRSFNAGFEVRRYDETRFAERVSRHLGTEHESFQVTAETSEILPRLLWHMDQPLADATIVPTYLLSRRTREHVKVVLGGEGGDELFAGYTHYQGMQINRLLRLLPSAARKAASATAERLPFFGHPRLGYLLDRVSRVLSSSLFPPFEDYLHKVAAFSLEELSVLFSPDFKEKTCGFEHMEALRRVSRENSGLPPVTRACLADLSIYLPCDMLAKVDRMSMACSLEARVPLLDEEFVKFAQSMPMGFKIRGLQTKLAFRKALEPWLPRGILDRPKRGFNPPLEFWLQQSLPAYLEAHGLMATFQETGLFNSVHIAALVDQHVRGRCNHARKLWALVAFGIWWQSVRGGREMPS